MEWIFGNACILDFRGSLHKLDMKLCNAEGLLIGIAEIKLYFGNIDYNVTRPFERWISSASIYEPHLASISALML